MRLISELKRRNVFRVGAAYAVVSWLVLQVVDVISPILETPDWVPKLILLVIAAGFIPTLAFAWAFELTPEGVRREKDVDRSKSISRQTGRKLDRMIIAVLALIIMVMVAERIWLSAADTQTHALDPAPRITAENQQQPQLHSTAARDRSIAVLPFSNRSVGEENTSFLADGIHDDLLTNLSKIRQLKVISRTSVMRYRNTTKNMRRIGEELGVATLLEGRVQQAGDRVRINVQLISSQTDEHLWAESFDREISTENIFDIQAGIARAIADALEATLTPEEDASLGKVPTESMEAYRALLMSRQFELRGNFESLEKASEYALEALDHDSDYVDAHLALARILTRAIASGASTDDEVGDRIHAAIASAMEARPAYGAAFSVQGYYLYIAGKSGWQDSFQTAMSLEPGNAETMYAYGYSLQRSGQPKAALPLLQKASEQDPLSQPILFALGRNYGVLEEYDKARKVFTRIREIDPSSILGYAPMGGSYLPEGRLDKALYWLGRAVQVDPKDYELGGWMVFLNDCLEDYDAAQEWSDWLDGWITKQPQPMAMQALHHYLTGNFELAIQISNRALKLGLADRWGSDAIFMRIKRDEALANGDPDGGIAVFRKRHPELFGRLPEITATNVMQAVDLAQLTKLSDRRDETRNLLEAVIRFYDQPFSTTGSLRSSLVPVKAEALAVMGDDDAALAELRRVIDGGWRVYWRWETVLNFNFNSIRERPEFRAMVRELTADMAEQRANAQAMADRDEIPPPPVVDGGLNAD